MPTVATKEQLIFLIVLLLPGFVVASVRSAFEVKRNTSAYQEILAYVLGSAICHVISAFAWKWIFDDTPAFWWQFLALVVILLVLPIAVGLCWSISVQREFTA